VISEVAPFIERKLAEGGYVTLLTIESCVGVGAVELEQGSGRKVVYACTALHAVIPER